MGGQDWIKEDEGISKKNVYIHNTHRQQCDSGQKEAGRGLGGDGQSVGAMGTTKKHTHH